MWFWTAHFEDWKEVNDMDNKELIQGLVNYDEEENQDVNNEQFKQQDTSSEGFVFDLNKIPKKVLNRAWTRYRPYLYAIDRDSPLNIGIYESTDYAQQASTVRNELVKFFPLKRDLFKIFPRHHKMFAILVANMEDNAEVVQKIMEDNGFFRSRPTDEEVRKDEEGRIWRQMWLEPKNPDKRFGDTPTDRDDKH